MIVLEYIFWVLVVLLVYPYLIYPALLKLMIKLGLRAGEPQSDSSNLPRVTFMISAYNEEAVIDEKLRNTMALDYPADKFEVIVVSDACDDRTDDIVREWSAKDARIKLVRQNERRGKS
ncbi:MAG: glycosyltransferase, partial [Calditrichaeota bacterium]|nr:glycosyltransferase [Calditrichota bacterium]